LDVKDIIPDAPPATAGAIQGEVAATDVARMRTILESLPLLWFRLDAGGVFLDFHVPPELEVMMVTSPERFLGRPLTEVMPPEVARVARAALGEVLATGESRRFEYPLSLGGEERWFHCCMVRAAADEAFAHVTDISAQREMERAMRGALEEAQASAQARSRFIATVSHEVRTPVTGILGMSELLRETELSAEQRSYVDMLQSSSRSLLAVVNDVLDLSKIEAGGLELDEVAFPPRELVEDVVAMLAERAHGKGLSLAARIEHGIPQTVLGDPKRLEQVLTNLVTNAIKFTMHGEVLVRVEVKRRTPAGVVLGLEVVDTGIGIHPSAQRDLFTPFVQADPFTARRFGGTGLGLAISRHLVELMGGQIAFASDPGTGSCFTFTVPLAVPTGYRVRGGTGGHALRPRLEGWRALVVARGAGLRDHLRHELEHVGIACHTVTDGHQAAACLAAAPGAYRLVLVELGAEVEAVDRIIAAGPTPASGDAEPFFVAMPRFGRREALARSVQAPFYDALTIPCRQRDLHGLLRRLAPPLASSESAAG